MQSTSSSRRRYAYALLFLYEPIERSLTLIILAGQADDELELPVLAGFEWDKEESWTRLIVHQKKEGQASNVGKKKGKKGKEEGDE